MTASDPVPSTRLTVVGIGASAGGLEALQRLFQSTPEDTGMAYVVILHLAPDRESHVSELLQRSTKMPVRQVTERIAMEPDHVYVIPPDGNLSSVDDHLEVLARPPAGQNRAPIDLFFRTLAETHGTTAIGVVLSGTGSDGAQGLRTIRERGGLTIAQEPEDAEHQGMPRAAIRTGTIDLVLPAERIGGELVRFRRSRPEPGAPASDEEPTEEDDLLPLIFRELKRAFGHDFTSYKRSTIERRLRRRLQLRGDPALGDYLRRLRDDPAEKEALHRDFLITVTSFFRDPDAFEVLETRVLPRLFDEKTGDDAVRVWVAGCATGEEAYTLAILLSEHARTLDDPPDVKIFATDVSEHAFNIAREGLYPEGIAADVSEARLERNFERERGGYRVKKHIRDMVLFASHDLLRDPPFSRLDLAVCRNVLIYLQRDTQQRVLEIFHYALHPGAFLFLGSSESTDPVGDLFETVDKSHRIFKTTLQPRHSTLPLLRPGRARPGPEVGPAEKDRPKLSLGQSYGMLHHELVEMYAPPSVVVDAGYRVVHVSAHASHLLRLPAGRLSPALLEMLPEGLRPDVQALLRAAFRGNEAARGRAVPVSIAGREAMIRPAVVPLSRGERAPGHALVLFEEVERRPDPDATEGETVKADRDPAHALELAEVKEQLQNALDEQAETVQRFQAAYEELQSINEEQQATTEELETSKEEIQSVNEELRTVNQEYRVKNEELAELNADLKNLIDSTDVATIFLDRGLAIRRFTPQVTTLFNFVTGDLGRPVGDLTHHLDYPGLVTDAASVIDSLNRVDREARTDDGRWFDVRMAPYRSSDDRIDGVVVNFIDVTAQKAAAQERESLLAEARAASEAKSRFIGTLSHEFRTPLSGIIGYADILADGVAGEVNEKQRKHLARIRIAGMQLGQMVDEILEFSRMESGQARLALDRVDLAELLRETADLLRPVSEEKRLELRVEIAADLPPLRTDAGKLRQVIVNLLGNALKFTKTGFVAVRARTSNAHVVVEVEDTGIGLSASDRNRVFERFWQADTSSTRTHGGTGLGLTLAQDLARMLGGDITLESELGLGTIFRLSLPLVAPQAT